MVCLLTTQVAAGNSSLLSCCLLLLSPVPACPPLVRHACLLQRGGSAPLPAPLTIPMAAPWQMAELPLDPVLARMLLASGEMGCTAEVLTVVAMLR